MHGHTHLKAAEAPGVSWAPRGQSWQGLAARDHPFSPDRSRAAQGIGHHSRHGDRQRPGWDIGAQVGPAWCGPWRGRARL